jgi:ABC-type branched-subunit amino acid transport system substrate-binding protein
VKILSRLILGFALVLGLAAHALAEDTIKIAFIAPFSGAFAPRGDAFLKELQYSLDVVNNMGGALGRKFELVTFDDKLQPAEAMIALKSVTDQNIPIVLQCIGSNVAAAMIDGVSKHNARDPDNPVLYLNCAALDFHHNIPSEVGNAQADAWIKGFRDKYPDFDYTWINYRTTFEMLQAAINKAGSVDPLKIALALEGMEFTDAVGQKNIMRRDDHQLIDQFYAAIFTKGVKYDSERTGFGWKTVKTIPAADLAQPTTYKMTRPAGA